MLEVKTEYVIDIEDVEKEFKIHMSDYEFTQMAENGSYVPLNCDDASLEVHFIDVGQADSILIQCDGENLLLDGGNKADSSLIYSYLKKYEITNLKYVINSHPHEDHVGGLSGALNFAKANQVFSSFSEYDSKAFNDFVKNTEKQNLFWEPLY